MGVIEIIRVVLYVVEWIWTMVILVIFPARLATKAPTLVWSVIGLVILTVTMVWYGIEYCTRFRLSERTEMLIFAWLAIWWLVASIAFTITKSNRAPTIATIPVVFAWMLFIFSLMSAFVAGRGAIRKTARAAPQATTVEPESVEEVTPS